MTLEEMKQLTVERFAGSTTRRNLFYKMEGLLQEFLTLKLPCEFWVDGSFLTEKEEPADIDIAVKVMDDVMAALNPDQDEFLTVVASHEPYIEGLDIFVFSGYWIGHPHYGTEVDDGYSRVAPTYGHLYGKGEDDWLKGIGVLMVWENTVGLRIRA